MLFILTCVLFSFIKEIKDIRMSETDKELEKELEKELDLNTPSLQEQTSPEESPQINQESEQEPFIPPEPELINPRTNDIESYIDVELNHTVYGWIPFTIRPEDIYTDAYSISYNLYELLIEGKFGEIKEAESRDMVWDNQDNVWVIPKKDVPQSVSKAQAKKVLRKYGYESQIIEWVNSPQGLEADADIAWQDAQEFNRNSEFVNGFGLLLGLTSEQIDNLFIEASEITF